MRGGPETIAVTYRPALLTQPGLHVGTVWARSATDTLGGPVFALFNTVVVPTKLAAPFRTRARLRAGGLARFFFEVPPDAGGLAFRTSAPEVKERATLYLFEPDGKPARSGASVSIGGKDSARAVLQVNAEDLVPGVYEVVLTAPPTAGALVDLEAAIPSVSVAARMPGGPATVRNGRDAALATGVRAELAGASSCCVG